jgi:hypothetical protein
MLSTRFRSAAYLLAFACLLTLLQTSANAQSLTFIDNNALTDWNNALPETASVEGDDYESIVDADGVPISEVNFEIGAIGLQNPQPLAWGSISGNSMDPDGRLVFGALFTQRLGVAQDPILFGIGRLTFTFDNPDRGLLEGLFFFMNSNNSLATIEFYNGDTLLESFEVDSEFRSSGFDETNPLTFPFGWVNTDGLDVTRVDILGPGVTVSEAQFAFAEVPPVIPPAMTCFDQLTDVRVAIEDLAAASEGSDAALLQCAADCVEWTQNDVFWVQPSSNRLTAYGGSVFIGAAYTVLYLENVDNPETDIIIDELLAVLECIVENEINYAIENGGHQCFIDRAIDLAELATIIDDDFDNELIATLAYRLAWLNAFYSTY